MNKIWKTLTPILPFVEKFEEWRSKGIEQIEISEQESDRPNPDILFKYSNGETEVFINWRAKTIFRVLLGYGLISSAKKVFINEWGIIENGIVYSLCVFDDEITISDFICKNIKNKIEKIFINNGELIFPREKKLLFSTLIIGLLTYKKCSEDAINMKIEAGSVKDLKKWYHKINHKLSSSNEYENLMEIAYKTIIGKTKKINKIIKNIDPEKSQNEKHFYIDNNALEGKINTQPLTLRKLLKSYFSLKHMVNIPIYQRKYIWPERTAKQLFNDILNVNDFHYIGNVVVQEKQKNGITITKIIDGQQRITTLILITRALFDYCKNEKWNVDTIANNVFDSKSDESLLKTFERIKGNNDYETFKKIISGDHNNDNLKDRKINAMVINYDSILKLISSKISSEEKSDKLWSSLLDKIMMVSIDVSGANEYQLFEKLNTSSIPLTTIELFKSFIFDKFLNEDSESENEVKAQKLFESNIYSKFSGKAKEKEINDFITTSLRFHNSILSDDTEFLQYKSLIEEEYIASGDDLGLNLKYILEAIGNEINVYNELRKYESYSKKTSWAYPFADFLHMLDGRTVYYPLILKILSLKSNDHKNLSQYEIKSIREYLRVIEIYEVRLQIAVGIGQSLSSKIENILEKFNEDSTPKDLWNMFSISKGESGMATIEKFSESIKNRDIRNKPARLLMTRLENFAYLKGWELPKNDYTFRAIYENASQREHLLPTKWERHWRSHLEETTGLKNEELESSVLKCINYIGNAFPIPDWSNNEIKNSSLEKKIKKFNESPYSNDIVMFKGVTINGVELDPIDYKFSIDTIIKRTESISEIAKHIWQDPNFE